MTKKRKITKKKNSTDGIVKRYRVPDDYISPFGCRKCGGGHVLEHRTRWIQRKTTTTVPCKCNEALPFAMQKTVTELVLVQDTGWIQPDGWMMPHKRKEIKTVQLSEQVEELCYECAVGPDVTVSIESSDAAKCSSSRVLVCPLCGHAQGLSGENQVFDLIGGYAEENL